MLTTSSCYGRRSRFLGTPTTGTSAGSPGTYLTRPKLPVRIYSKPKVPANFSNYADSTTLARMKRLKSRKINGIQKMDLTKKRSPDYTEMAYREAVSKLKYLLAESYGSRTSPGKTQSIRNVYQTSNQRINESGEDTDDRSVISDASRTKDFNLNTFTSPYISSSKTIQPSKGSSNLALSAADLQSVPPELTSFIERQEEYIEQLERESQYCKDELTNLLSKVREVVAENEALHSRNKSGFLKCALEEHRSFAEECHQSCKETPVQADFAEHKKTILQKPLEGPSIVFESRISELEAQLTQTKLELRKAQEENQANLKRLSECCLSTDTPEMKMQLEQAMRGKQEAEMKLEDLQRSLSAARGKEADAVQKAKRSTDLLQQIEFEKKQDQLEIRRLKEELERQHEKVREATQEASRRIAEERQQAERRYSQQVEQLSADIASHWDAANKSQLESEKQRRELTELRRELSQKQAFIDNLKKELQNKISSLQSELNEALTEKDAAEQEVLTAKLATERCERQARQEQSRLQAEINSYKQRLERADADLVHCRRENLRLSEQIASLEKEISMNKITHQEEARPQATPRAENEKELTSMIMDMETKHEGTERDVTRVGKTASSSDKKRTVKVDLKVKVIPKKKSDSSSKTPLSAQEEMANLQSNIEYLSNKIQGTIDNQTASSNRLNGSKLPIDPNQTDSPMFDKDHAAMNNQPDEKQTELNYGTPQIHSESQEYHLENKPETDTTTQEYGYSNETHNQEQYAADEQNIDSYYPEQQYNQYEQYDQSQYEEQQYTDNNVYSAKDTSNDQQYTEEQNVSDTAKPDTELPH